jgi:hypothetical protein
VRLSVSPPPRTYPKEVIVFNPSPAVQRTRKNASRAARAAALIGGIALVLASQAGATTGSPRTLHATFQESGQFTDDAATAACGFPVTFSYDNRAEFNALFDGNGNFLHGTFTSNGTATESANGITLTGKIEDNQIFFATTQQVYEVGLVDTLKLPGGGVVQIDVGRIVWTFDAWFGGGTPTIVEGPHQALEGDDAALCAALTP